MIRLPPELTPAPGVANRMMANDTPMSLAIFVGVDLSPDHFGVVEMGGTRSIGGVWYMSNRRAETTLKWGPLDTQRVCGEQWYLPKWTKKTGGKTWGGKENYHAARRHFHEVLFDDIARELAVLSAPSRPVYINVESPAYSAVTFQHDAAEIKGVVLSKLINILGNRCHIRHTNPQTLQKWAGKGGCSKRDRREFARRFLTVSVVDDLFREGKKDLEGVGTDIVDATILASMVHREVAYRRGYVVLADLPQKQREVFQKMQDGIPLTERPFVCSELWTKEGDLVCR